MRASRSELPELLDLPHAPPTGRSTFHQCFEFSPPVPHEQILDVVKRNTAMAQTASSVEPVVSGIQVVIMLRLACCLAS